MNKSSFTNAIQLIKIKRDINEYERRNPFALSGSQVVSSSYNPGEEAELRTIHLKQYYTPNLNPNQIESKATGRIGSSFFFGNDEAGGNQAPLNHIPEDIKQSLRYLRRKIPLPNYGRYSTSDEMLELAGKDMFDLENVHFRRQFNPKLDSIFHESNYRIEEEFEQKIYAKDRKNVVLSKLNNNLRDVMRAQEEEKLAEENRKFKPFSRFDKKYREKRVITKKADMIYNPGDMKLPKSKRRYVRFHEGNNKSNTSKSENEVEEEEESMEERQTWKERESPFKRKIGTPDNNGLYECSEGCGRKFGLSALHKHEKICRSVFQNKRKKFDSTSKRVLDESEIYNNMDVGLKKGANLHRARLTPMEKRTKHLLDIVKHKEEKAPSGDKPRWLKQSEAFRAMLKSARGGVPTKGEEELMKNVSQDGLKECIFCGRKFEDKALHKHVKSCENSFKISSLHKKPMNFKKR